MQNEHRYSWDKPKKTNENLFIQIALGIFFGLIATWFAVEKYYEYQAKKAAEEFITSMNRMNQRMIEESKQFIQKQNAEIQRIQAEQAKQKYVNNYWVDIGAGAFVNVGRSRREGDLTIAIIKNQGAEQEMQVNCRNRSYYSDQIQDWYIPQDPNSISVRVIKAVCS